MLVAEGDGTPVGCGLAFATESKKFYAEPKMGYLGLIYVEPQWRNKGIGTQIVTTLKEWAIEKGLEGFSILEVFAANEAAIALYKKCGFKPHKIEMIYQPN